MRAYVRMRLRSARWSATQCWRQQHEVAIGGKSPTIAANRKRAAKPRSEAENHRRLAYTLTGATKRRAECPLLFFLGFLGIVFKTLLPKYIEVVVSILSMCAGLFGIANHTHLIEPTNSTSHSECSRINVNCFECPLPDLLHH